MDEDWFWTLITLLGDDHDVERLSTALMRLDEHELLSFHDRLAAAVAKLNTEAHAEQLVSDVDDPPGSRSAMSEDVFEFARLAVVAGGRATWTSVVQDPTKLTGNWPMTIGEDILDAVRNAYEETTGNPWPELTLSGPHASQLPAPPRRNWLSIFDTERDDDGRRVRLPNGYRDHLNYLAQVVNQDQVWWQWWDQARGEESTLECRVEFERGRRPGTSTREAKDWTGRDHVICVIRTIPPEDPDETPERGTSGPELARQHFDLLLAQLKRRYGLIPPVKLPDTAELEQCRRKWAGERGNAVGRERREMAEWNRKRSSEHIWRGRAPDSAVDELIRATKQGGRITRVPGMIANLRKTYNIPLDPTDAERLAEAGYNPSEIELILGPTNTGTDQ